MTLNRFIKNTLKVIIPAAIIGGAWHQGMFFSEDTYQTGNVVAEKYIPKSLQEQTHVGFVSSHDYVGMGESQYLLTVNSDGRLWVLDVQDSNRRGLYTTDSHTSPINYHNSGTNKAHIPFTGLCADFKSD